MVSGPEALRPGLWKTRWGCLLSRSCDRIKVPSGAGALNCYYRVKCLEPGPQWLLHGRLADTGGTAQRDRDRVGLVDLDAHVMIGWRLSRGRLFRVVSMVPWPTPATSLRSVLEDCPAYEVIARHVRQ